MLSSFNNIHLVVLIIVHLYLLVPVGERNIQLITDNFLKVIGRVDEGLKGESEFRKEDNKSEEIKLIGTINNQVRTDNFIKAIEKLDGDVVEESETVKEDDKPEDASPKNLQVRAVELIQSLKKLNEDLQERRSIKENATSEEILPLDMTYLTPALMEKARRELNETEEVKQKALVEFRRLIEAEENLVSRTDDIFLLAFLRKNKFDVAKSFKRLQVYWAFKAEYSDIFDNVDTERVCAFLAKSLLGYLMHRDKEGSVVLVLKPGMWNPDEDLFEDILLSMSGLSAFALDTEATQIAGYRIIYDLRGFSWRQLKYLAPSYLYITIKAAVYTAPARLKRVHLLGDDGILKFIWDVAYPFLPEELRDIMVFHGYDFEALQEFIHPSVLPEELGGQAPYFVNHMDFVRKNMGKVTAQLDYGYKN